MRYPGIAVQRLRLDYSGMVSAYVEGLGNTKADFMALFGESSSRSDVGNDWQGVTDMIITRFSDRLQLMSGNNTLRDTILLDIAVLINLYIDYGDLNVPTAIEKCSAH